jgi:hypothetical protein
LRGAFKILDVSPNAIGRGPLYRGRSKRSPPRALPYEIVSHYNPEQDEQKDQETVEVFLGRVHLAQRECADSMQYFEEATQSVIILAPRVAPMKLSMKIETNQSFDCFGSPG